MVLFCESKVPIWSSLLCYTDKTRRGAPCFLVANIPSAAIGFHKLLGFLWLYNQFFQQCTVNLMKRFFSLFLVLTISLQLFLFFVLLFVFFQASKHLCNSSTCALEKTIYICGIFQIEVATQVFQTFWMVLQSQKGTGHLGFWGMIGSQVIKIDVFSVRSYCNTDYLVVFALFALYYL